MAQDPHTHTESTDTQNPAIFYVYTQNRAHRSPYAPVSTPTTTEPLRTHHRPPPQLSTTLVHLTLLIEHRLSASATKAHAAAAASS